MTQTTATTPFERHCAQLQRQPALSEADELALATKWVKHRDRRAGDQLVEAHLPLVLRMAKRLRGYGVPRDELMAEGNVGLLRALEKFDLRGVRFKTYATYWIRAQMLACAQRQTSIVTAATGALGAKFFFKLRSARAKAETQFGNNAEVVNAYLADQFGVSEEVIRMHSARLSSSDSSLDAPLGDEGDFTALDLLACRLAGPEEKVGAQERDTLVADTLQRVWPALDAREKALVTDRLMSDDEEMTLSDIGARFKLSRERLRQIEQRLKERFRRALGDQGLVDATQWH